ncbi:DUF6882 domain-containing protein [Arthrobacter sp. ISL-95]|uniref:DUF6882 domain-containing protein n=1 Tax=Arthrobacter sp. ISL-95 TaxID=2819116 RepID=UPI001BE671AB|nr:DUF6882 domain-containing protein [Arthrobacter sp. ISL-95]MBT2587612.1 hypothetical protein [Arthrobacter sp. ISL-95]
MTELTFQNIVDDGAILFLETHHMQDDRFEEWGYERWHTADQFASVEFHFPGRSSKHLQTAFVGTSGPGPKSFLWGWANPNVAATPAQKEVFDQVVAFGRHYGIDELTNGEVPFTSIVPAFADEEVRLSAEKAGSTLVAFKIATAVKMITGRANHFTSNIGRGSMAVVAYNHGSLELGPPSALTFQMRFMEAVAAGMIEDHRRAVESYARFRLQTPVTEPSPGTLEVTFDDGQATIAFDENNRLTTMNASLTGLPSA